MLDQLPTFLYKARQAETCLSIALMVNIIGTEVYIMNEEFDYNNIITTAETNMDKRWNLEDWMEDTIQDILEDWLTKNAQELGSEILSFTLRDIQQEVNKRHKKHLDNQANVFDSSYLRYADTYFYVEQVISVMQDEADEQNVDLTVEQTTSEIYTIRLETKDDQNE